MILIQANDTLYTYEGDRFQALPSLQEATITQADFEAHGMTPEDVRKITQETWRDFTVSCDAMEFDILVFTTFDEEPEVMLDATELVTFAAFDAILPTNVWKDNSFVIEVGSQTEPEGYPAQSVYYEIYKGTPENLLFSGMTPGSHLVENIEEDTVFILNTGALGHIPFLVKREDEGTLVVERSFSFGGVEWESYGVSFSEESEPANKWMLGFDGNSSGVAIPPELNLYNSSFTKECWFYREDSTRGIIFGTYKASTDVNVEFTTDNKIRIYWTSEHDMTLPVVVPLNTWTHFAWVRDKEADEQRIYINGELVWTHSSALPDRDITHSSWVGRDIRTGTTVFKGKLDEVRIWDVARTEAEIKSTLNKKLLLHPLGLRAYFAFEEGEGTTTVDVANGYAGTLNNTLWLPAEVSLIRKPLYMEGATAHLSEGVSSGVLKTNHSQVVTLGRKTISGVTVLGSDDLTEEVLVGEPMASIGENLYEAKIPKGKRLIIEVVE